MKIIISPAKAMVQRDNIYAWQNKPILIEKTLQLLKQLSSMDYDSLKSLWKCNDEIAKLNYQRLARMELDKELCPAIVAYDGIQYQSMRSNEFNEIELDYLQKHLRILSGFYGMLKPLDGIRPYRLEMQAKLQVGGFKDLYSFWGSSISEAITDGEDCILNLASKEYSRCISKYVPDACRFISCIFGEEKDGKLIEKGTMCKIARGEMVRWLAENNIQDPTELSNFEGTYHRYCEKYSNETTIAFIRK